MARVYEAMMMAQEQSPAITDQLKQEDDFPEAMPAPTVAAPMMLAHEAEPLDLEELGLEATPAPFSDPVEANVAVAETIADSVDSLAISLNPEAPSASVIPISSRLSIATSDATSEKGDSSALVPETYRAEFQQLGEIVRRAASERTLKAIQVCGVEQSDLADFVVENLALALAENPALRVARFRLVAPPPLSPSVTPEDFRLRLGRTAIPNLCEVVPVNGPLPLVELLRECDVELMIEMLRNRFDFILIETDAVNYDDEVATFAGKTDGVILVAQKENMRGSTMNCAREKMQKSGAKILGAVLSRHREQEALPRVA